MPVQASDTLPEILEAQASPSASAAFVGNVSRAGMMRPLRFWQIKALFDLADGQHWLAYRGFHAALVIVAVLLFARVLAVQTWADFAAGSFALTIFTGLHTFAGTLREAFPIPHYLEIVVLCLLVLNLARSRGGWLIDVAAVASFVVASLTLESGVLVWVVVVTAWACGLRGISRYGIGATTVLFGMYLSARFWIGLPGVEAHSSGFLLSIPDSHELLQRFGGDPTPFYAYNVAVSIMSVLFSEPRAGVFELVRAWSEGDVPPRLYVAVISSVLTTLLIAGVVAARLLGRGPRTRTADDQLFVLFAAVLLANGVVSYAYTKDEIVSIAGAFYALVAFAAVRAVLDSSPTPLRGAVHVSLCLVLCAVATLWAFRSAGVHHALRVQAFKHRNDWARLAETTPAAATPDPGAALAEQLRREAIDMRGPTPDLLGRWPDRWWGE